MSDANWNTYPSMRWDRNSEFFAGWRSHPPVGMKILCTTVMRSVAGDSWISLTVIVRGTRARKPGSAVSCGTEESQWLYFKTHGGNVHGSGTDFYSFLKNNIREFDCSLAKRKV